MFGNKENDLGNVFGKNESFFRKHFPFPCSVAFQKIVSIQSDNSSFHYEIPLSQHVQRVLHCLVLEQAHVFSQPNVLNFMLHVKI